MRRWSVSTEADDRGSAALEFILVGLLLLVPTVYLILALGAIQGQALGAEAGARHIARAIATAQDADQAQQRADAILAAVTREYGLDQAAVRIDCQPPGASCPYPGALLTVTVTSQAVLPLVPPILGLEHIAVVPVEAVAAQRVSRFWGSS